MRARSLAACVLAACASACGPRPAHVEVATLPADRPYIGTLVLDEANEQFFRVALPPDAVSVTLELECADAELALDVNLGAEPPREHETGDFDVHCDGGRARIAIDRFSEPVLTGDALALRVAWESHARPSSSSRELDDLPYTLRARVFRSRGDGELAPGGAVSVHEVRGTVGRSSGGFRSYAVRVPASARVLRFDLLDTDADLDLLARPGAPIVHLGPDVRRAQHPYGRETLVVRRDEVGEPSGARASETWFVDVVDAQDSERDTTFRLRASCAAEPPPDLLELPELVGARAPRLEPAFLGAVVEIETEHGVGSGTLIGTDGWVLTNAHVVEGREMPDGEVVVAVCLDATRPPIETFRGSVELVDELADLALVRIEKGFYGQPLPPGYRFPALRLGDGELPAIGAPIRIVGYPLTGGQGTRVSISLTRGVVAGFDRGESGLILKTDAEITNGNSGGAALDDAGCLIGIPSATVENGSGQIGYVHPLPLVPAEWLALAGAVRCR